MGVVRARGGCGHALAAFKYSLNTLKKCNQVWVVARPGWCGVGGEGAGG